ncbi:hypothetical protein REJ26_004375 [Providencia stuartii]|uniref:hypothetical protein n=1 Tax=Providencia sp. 2023EL-00965 TaxID=3084975 RepID=UPI0027F3F6CB|nr:hypothetical protein [Providencia sp. 2023EL-00965]ELR5302503.1 hypothetical protein [Providencia stuartii]MDW7590969.1 hypothetical protein [Providencia sp. 2023EL-00965]
MKIEEQYIESIYSNCQGVESLIYSLKKSADELVGDKSQQITGRKHLSTDENDNILRYLKFNLCSMLNAHASVLDYFYNLLLTKVGFTQDDINGQTFSLMYDKEVISFIEGLGREGKKTKAFEELGLNELNIKIAKYREEHNEYSEGMPNDIDLMREIFSAYFKNKHFRILSKRKYIIDEICDVLFGYTQRLHPAMVYQSYTPAILKELNNLVKHNFIPDIIPIFPYKGLFINLKNDAIPYLNDGLIKKILELDFSVFERSECMMNVNKSFAYKDIPLFNETNIFGFKFETVSGCVNYSEFMIDNIFFVKSKAGIIISYFDIQSEILKTIGNIKESIDSLVDDDRINHIVTSSKIRQL